MSPWPDNGFAPATETESEVVLRLDGAEEILHITSAWPKWSRRFYKRFGKPTRVSRRPDGSVTCAFWTLPIAAFKMPRLPRPAKPKTEVQVEAGRRLARTRLRDAMNPPKNT